MAPMEGSYLVLTNRLMVGLGTNNFIPAPGYYLKTNNVDIVIGPGISLTNGWIQFNPGTVINTILPGTPREGEVLTTEEVEVRPCFAAVYPPCPGHAHTNLTRWRWASGAWNRVPETNATIFWAGTTLPFTNLVSTNSIDWAMSATNITMKLSEDSRIRKALKELTDALGGLE